MDRRILASMALVLPLAVLVAEAKLRGEPAPTLGAVVNTQGAPPPPAAEEAAEPPPLAALEERADRGFVRWYRSPLAGGLLTFPPSFSSEDGRYDLVIHFNGNTQLVEESYGAAGVNAVVIILNLGVGSGLYEDRFEDPAAFRLLLDRTQAVMESRGLRGARLDRVAISAWSSGYGGVMKVLGQQALFDRIDAVVLFDAIHCGIEPWSKRLKPSQLEPIGRFAQKAAEGKALLSITHSEIETYGYANAHKTTDAVLDFAGLRRTPASTPQPMPELVSMVGVLPKSLMVPMRPLSEAHRGGLHVRGYAGNGPVAHMLHLVQMSTIALPDLTAYWKR